MLNTGIRMNENTQIFLDFWNTFKWPEPVVVQYRLYYNDDGEPVVYSMEDLPGKYIEVTEQQYSEHSYRVSVVDGQLIKKLPNAITTKKLIPCNTGTPCHLTNVAIVTTTDPNQKWNLKTYDNS